MKIGSNPMMNTKVLENVEVDSVPMTVSGTINKTLILLIIAAASGVCTWNICLQGFADKANMLIGVGGICALILAIITCFSPKNAPITAPAYAICEGLALGGVSFAYSYFYDGIVVNAILITFMVLFTMLFLYRSKTVQATPKFRKVVTISTISCFLFYLICGISSLLGHSLNVFNSGLLGIGISFFICIVASLNFILDFDFIERGANSFSPKYYEWYGAFGIMVTLVWLYLELLRLLAQITQRR